MTGFYLMETLAVKGLIFVAITNCCHWLTQKKLLHWTQEKNPDSNLQYYQRKLQEKWNSKLLSYLNVLPRIKVSSYVIIIQLGVRKHWFYWKQSVGNKGKGQISKRVFQENKARQIFRKMNISHPLIRTVFAVLCFFKTPVLRLALLPYYRQITKQCFSTNLKCFIFFHKFYTFPLANFRN